MAEKKLYEVTEKAGPWVAGQRRPADGRLWLTPHQAAYELTLGTIRLVLSPDPALAPVARGKLRRKRKAKD